MTRRLEVGVQMTHVSFLSLATIPLIPPRRPGLREHWLPDVHHDCHQHLYQRYGTLYHPCRPPLTSSAQSATAASSSAADAASIQSLIDAQYSSSDVVHSFLTRAGETTGETIDCVDFFHTPAAKALARKAPP